MPLIQVTTTAEVPTEKQDKVMSALSKAVCGVTGKNEDYLMVMLSQGVGYMGGVAGSATFVDVRAIGGIGPEINRELSSVICGIVEELLGTPPSRVYINFIDVAATDWGWDNGTFGT